MKLSAVLLLAVVVCFTDARMKMRKLREARPRDYFRTLQSPDLETVEQSVPVEAGTSDQSAGEFAEEPQFRTAEPQNPAFPSPPAFPQSPLSNNQIANTPFQQQQLNAFNQAIQQHPFAQQQHPFQQRQTGQQQQQSPYSPGAILQNLIGQNPTNAQLVGVSQTYGANPAATAATQNYGGAAAAGGSPNYGGAAAGGTPNYGGAAAGGSPSYGGAAAGGSPSYGGAAAGGSPSYGGAAAGGGYGSSGGSASYKAPSTPDEILLSKLVSNATVIRPYIKAGFSCTGRIFGYYADVLNDCQLFHICYPLRQVFNNNPYVPDVTYQFSFICPAYTIFSQDARVCAWSHSAFPCSEAESMYNINQDFFKIPPPTTGGGGYETPAPVVQPQINYGTPVVPGAVYPQQG